jgi:hypothetical protein
MGAEQAPDIRWGWVAALTKMGALPETVVWDREAAIAPKGKPTDAFVAFCGALLSAGRSARPKARSQRAS